MSETSTLYRFKMRAVEKDSSGYYFARWDRAVPVEAVAATKKDAIKKADTMLGETRRGWHWAFIVDSISEELVAVESLQTQRVASDD